MESVSSPSTSRKKPLGFFWRMRMAFSVVSTMDGSMFGSLSISKRRSPGSNRAGVGGKDRFPCKNTLCMSHQPTMEVQQKGKSYLPPPTTTIFSAQELIHHSVRVQYKVSTAASELSPEKERWLTHHTTKKTLSLLTSWYCKSSWLYVSCTAPNGRQSHYMS